MPISTIGQNGLNAPLSLTSPALGTPSAINLSNATSLARAALPSGSVVQVVQYTSTTDYDTSSTTVVQGPQTNTFTLTNTSNKILVTANFSARIGNSSVQGGRYVLYRGSIATGTKLTTGAEPQIYHASAGAESYHILTLQYLDTPSGNTTYSIGFWKHPSAGSISLWGSFLLTTIIMQEIAI
jgi:hypothetical protein